MEPRYNPAPFERSPRPGRIDCIGKPDPEKEAQWARDRAALEERIRASREEAAKNRARQAAGMEEDRKRRERTHERVLNGEL